MLFPKRFPQNYQAAYGFFKQSRNNKQDQAGNSQLEGQNN